MATSGTHAALVGLTEMIAGGRFPSGSRLPAEPELSDQLGVSRTTLREAVRALAYAGVLDVRQGDGTYVTASDPSRVFSGLGMLSATASDEELRAVIEARRIVEPQLAGLAAQRRDDGDLEAMESHIRDMEAATSIEGLVDADLAFHRAVASAARSSVLEHFLNNLASHTLVARVWHGTEETQRNTAAIESHRLILGAIDNQDSTLAAAQALAHVATLEAWLAAAAHA